MGKRKTYEVESMEDLRQMIEELPDGVILEDIKRASCGAGWRKSGPNSALYSLDRTDSVTFRDG